MPDLDTQLREYLEATAPPVEFQEIRRSLPAQMPSDGLERWRRIPAWSYGVGAAVVVLFVLGGLNLTLNPAETADGQVTSTTVGEPVAPTTVPPPDIGAANLSQLLNLEMFLVPMVNYGGCSGPMGGPYVCTAGVGPPFVDEGVGIEVTVGPDDDEGHPDEQERISLLGTQLEALMRERLAELYESALAEHRDETLEKCGEAFTGTNQVLALSPGFAATGVCGLHLATVAYPLTDDSTTPPNEGWLDGCSTLPLGHGPQNC